MFSCFFISFLFYNVAISYYYSPSVGLANMTADRNNWLNLANSKSSSWQGTANISDTYFDGYPSGYPGGGNCKITIPINFGFIPQILLVRIQKTFTSQVAYTAVTVANPIITNKQRFYIYSNNGAGIELGLMDITQNSFAIRSGIGFWNLLLPANIPNGNSYELEIYAYS